MAVCSLRTLLLIVCVLELIVTIQRQVFDFMGYMWLPIIVNFVNILLIIFGSFGAVQYISKYLLAYAIWSFIWFSWNIFLICYYINLGSLNRESGLLSLGTGSVSWWEGNGWGCQPVWGESDTPDAWRPTRVEGCFFQWYHVELGQSIVAALLTITAMPLAMVLSYRSLTKEKPVSEKGTLQRRPVYTVELNMAETNMNECTLKPMTPRRVKRRSGSRGNGSSVRRSRRSYRNAGYLSSSASLPRDSAPRPTSAHSSYSNFHEARPITYHGPEREGLSRSQEVYEPPPPPSDMMAITSRYDTVSRGSVSTGYDVVGPYKDIAIGTRNDRTNYDTNSRSYDKMSGNYDTLLEMPPCEPSPYGAGWEAPPPPAPPYSARATPQAPGPPAYHPTNDPYSNLSHQQQQSSCALYQ